MPTAGDSKQVQRGEAHQEKADQRHHVAHRIAENRVPRPRMCSTETESEREGEGEGVERKHMEGTLLFKGSRESLLHSWPSYLGSKKGS